MNDIIRDMINGYTAAFDAYTISDPALKEETEQLKAEFAAFGEANSDMGTFFDKLAQSGLQEKYMALITKISMASMQTAAPEQSAETQQEGSADAQGGSSAPTITPRQFVEQYRAAYDEIKKSGYRTRACAAYEQLLAVPDSCADILEAQIKLEQERLLWRIVKDDMLDIFETVLAAMDPLDDSTAGAVRLRTEAVQQSGSDEELTYRLEKLDTAVTAAVQRAAMLVSLYALISKQLLDYCKAKIAVYEWQNDTLASGGIMAMANLREQIRRTLGFIEAEWGLSFEQIISDETQRLWMLAPQAVDATARVKTCLNPHNLEVYRDIVENEILSDMSLEDALLRGQKDWIWFDLNSAEKSDYTARAEKKAALLDSELTYFKYIDELGKYAAGAAK